MFLIFFCLAVSNPKQDSNQPEELAETTSESIYVHCRLISCTVWLQITWKISHLFYFLMRWGTLATLATLATLLPTRVNEPWRFAASLKRAAKSVVCWVREAMFPENTVKCYRRWTWIARKVQNPGLAHPVFPAGARSWGFKLQWIINIWQFSLLPLRTGTWACVVE